MTDEGSTAQGGTDAMSRSLAEAMRDQMQRQERLRHVQTFLNSPLFFDLGAAPASVSDTPAMLQEHHRELVYRIGIMESLLALMVEERKILETLMARQKSDPAAELAAELGVDEMAEALREAGQA